MNLKQSSHEPIINDIFSYLCPSAENIQKINSNSNSNQTINSKLNKDEPLKGITVIDFLFCPWITRHHSSWLLAYLPAIALKAAAAERDADLTLILFSHNSLYLF